jgi:hypothetical protein
MTQDDQIALTRAFDRWFKGNEVAARFCADMTEIAHTWDDLVDADKPVPSAAADRIFRKMVLEVPANEFYRAHFGFLHPVMVMVWGQWSAANVMEAKPLRGDREKAFMLRASLYQLFHACAVICGGLDWASLIGPEIYRFYGESLESFDA